MGAVKPLGTSGPEDVQLKRDAYLHPGARFALTLSRYLRGKLNWNGSAGFASEKVMKVTRGSGASGKTARYADALDEVAGTQSVVIDMETAGITSGAPSLVNLTAVIRVVTDDGANKDADIGKVLQKGRLRAHSGDLFSLLDYLTEPSNAPLGVLLSWVLTGAARHVRRLESGVPGRPSEELVEAMVDLAIDLIAAYRPANQGREWSAVDIRAHLDAHFGESDYPQGAYSRDSAFLNEWAELVLACDEAYVEGYGLDSIGFRPDQEWALRRERQEELAVQLARDFRARLLARLQ